MASFPPPSSFDGFQNASHPSNTPPPLSTITTTITTTYTPASLQTSNAIYAATQTAYSAASTDTTSNVDASTTSNLPVQIANSFSLVACIAVLIVYLVLRRKSKRIMERPSLVLAVSMATADGLLHIINLFGYTQLPHNFICAFFGGFLYAFPTLTSIFYSFCIALNTQLVFVFSKRPGNTTLKYYIGVPVLLSLCICIPALGVGAYGYDESYDLCWYSWNGDGSHRIFIRYFFTFGIWCLGTMIYLVVAATTIIHAVFAKSSRINQLATSNGSSQARNSKRASRLSGSRAPDRVKSLPSYQLPTVIITEHYAGAESLKSEFESEPATPNTPGNSFFNTAAQSPRDATQQQPRIKNKTLSRRTLAMRALALRLLGYILIPTVCILPGVIQDVVSKTNPDAAAQIPDRVSTMFDTLNGLVGLFNAILFALDPSLLALYHVLRIRKREKGIERQRENGLGLGNEEMQVGGQRIAHYEMADTRTGFSAYETQPDAMLTVYDPNALDMVHGEINDTRRVELGNGTKVEVRRGRTLSPIFIGRGRRGSSPGSFLESGTSAGTGIAIRVDVEIEDDGYDGDQDLERLERYLGGL